MKTKVEATLESFKGNFSILAASRLFAVCFVQEPKISTIYPVKWQGFSYYYSAAAQST